MTTLVGVLLGSSSAFLRAAGRPGGRKYTTSALTVVRRTDRSILQLKGHDTETFFHKLCSNDVHALTPGGAGAAGIFLPSGRMLFDVLYYSPALVPALGIAHVDGLIVECDTRVRDDMMLFLKRYRLRSKVEMTDISDQYQSVRVFGPDEKLSTLNSTPWGTRLGATVRDPRAADLGLAALANRSDLEGVQFEGAEVKGDDAYHALRMVNGVGEGPVDHPMQQTFPLQVNLEYLHSVSFTKKCYLGQELTARTHYRGTTRKRLLPVVTAPVEGGSMPGSGYSGVGEMPAADTKLYVDGKEVGEMRTSVGNVGLALLKVEAVAAGTVTVDGTGAALTVLRPAWLPDSALVVQ